MRPSLSIAAKMLTPLYSPNHLSKLYLTRSKSCLNLMRKRKTALLLNPLRLMMRPSSEILRTQKYQMIMMLTLNSLVKRQINLMRNDKVLRPCFKLYVTLRLLPLTPIRLRSTRLIASLTNLLICQPVNGDCSVAPQWTLPSRSSNWMPCKLSCLLLLSNTKITSLLNQVKTLITLFKYVPI